MRERKNRNEVLKKEIDIAKTKFIKELNEYKERNGLTQNDLSLMLNHSQPFTSSLLSGKQNISLEKMVEILFLIGKRIDFIFSEMPIAQRIN